MSLSGGVKPNIALKVSVFAGVEIIHGCLTT